MIIAFLFWLFCLAVVVAYFGRLTKLDPEEKLSLAAASVLLTLAPLTMAIIIGELLADLEQTRKARIKK